MGNYTNPYMVGFTVTEPPEEPEEPECPKCGAEGVELEWDCDPDANAQWLQPQLCIKCAAIAEAEEE